MIPYYCDHNVGGFRGFHGGVVGVVFRESDCGGGAELLLDAIERADGVAGRAAVPIEGDDVCVGADDGDGF